MEQVIALLLFQKVMKIIPLIEMIQPSEITQPSNLKQTSSSFDDTPTFTWIDSVYIEEIKGYYVKIDNKPEIFIGDTTSWTSSENLSNGVHTFYVRALGTDNTTNRYATVAFSIDTMFIDTDGDGWSDEEEQQYGTDPNEYNNYPLDIDNDHIPDSTDTDDDNDGYNDDIELSYETDTKDPKSYPTDTDGDNIPDSEDLCVDLHISNDPNPPVTDPVTGSINHLNTDSDGYGDACDPDDDNDSICDGAAASTDPGTPAGGCSAGPDNCALTVNTSQDDLDCDDKGDVCDADRDGDGYSDADEISTYGTSPTNADSDGDGITDGNQAPACPAGLAAGPDSTPLGDPTVTIAF